MGFIYWSFLLDLLIMLVPILLVIVVINGASVSALNFMMKKVKIDNTFVILPGFGNDAIDYINPLDLGFENSLSYSLKSCEIENVEVVPIKRSGWIKIGYSLFTTEFWKNSCRPEQLFDFYLQQVSETVRAAHSRTGKPVVLICHSAGGWLARALLADGKLSLDNKTPHISSLIAGIVTLGTPQFPPLDRNADMTRGALRYVNDNYPGSFLSDQGIFYVTVCGTAITGDVNAPSKSMQKFASNSYLQVTADKESFGNEVGDGLVPLRFAHLDGALQLTLEDTWHSINAPNNKWYGGIDAVNKWLPPTLKLLNSKKSPQRVVKK